MYFLNGERLIDLIKQVSCTCNKTQIGKNEPQVDETTIELKLRKNILKNAIGNQIPKDSTLEAFTTQLLAYHFKNYEKDTDLYVQEPSTLNTAHKDTSQKTGADNETITINLVSPTLGPVKALAKLHLYEHSAQVTDIIHKKASPEDKAAPEENRYEYSIIYDDASIMTHDDIPLFHPEDMPFYKNSIQGELSKDRPIEIDPEGNYLSFNYSLAAFYKNPANAGINFDTASKGLVEYDIRQILKEAYGQEDLPDKIIGSNMISHGYILSVENDPSAKYEVRVCVDFFSDTLFRQAIESLGLKEEHRETLLQQKRDAQKDDDLNHLAV